MKDLLDDFQANSNSPIGIFDSGVGGLTVAKEIKRQMPHEDLIYFGDTKHLPYGDKSREAIVEYCIRITEFLLAERCKAIVVACNTATANALEEIRKTINGKALLFDVINPVAEEVAEGHFREAGVIATKSTVRTGLYKKTIRKHNKNLKVQELATPLLVPAIEEGFISHPITHSILDHYLSNKKLARIDAIVLGCTHYPLLTKDIKRYYGERVCIIDSPGIVAHQVKEILQEKHLTNDPKHEASYRFYLSDITKNFERISKRFFGNEISLELRDIHQK